jgi:hypothetical protein
LFSEDLMDFYRKSRSLGQTLTLLLTFIVLGCSDNGTQPNKDLAPLVGAWQANTLVMTNQANTSISVDLVEQGATFNLSILSTGQYSASLTAFGIAGTEVGMVTIAGNEVTIAPTTPPGTPLVAIWSIQGNDLVLDGDSEFDFNQDGETEPSFSHIVLDRIGF